MFILIDGAHELIKIFSIFTIVYQEIELNSTTRESLSTNIVLARSSKRNGIVLMFHYAV